MNQLDLMPLPLPFRLSTVVKPITLPLSIATKEGNLVQMAAVMDRDSAAIDAVENGLTACHIAIQFDQIDALKFLIVRGAKICQNQSDNPLLLPFAVEHSRGSKVLLVLFDAGASTDGLTSEQLTRLIGRTKSVRVLKHLLAHNVDVNALRPLAFDAGGTICHHVLLNSEPDDDVAEFLRALVELAGIDVNATNFYGSTPLHCATRACNRSALRTLVELGADIDAQEKIGDSALHRLCCLMNDEAELAELILALGANANLVTIQGEEACHLAALHWRFGSLCALLAAGGNLDWPNNRGVTPRAIAIDHGRSLPTADDIDAARRRIAAARLDLVRERAFQICLGLRPLDLDALQVCEILSHSFGALGSLIAFHQWWAFATKAKHFAAKKNEE